MLDKLFRLKQNKTDVKTEITAGITTFMTMAYILAVNPGILSSAGMDPTAVMLATCIASFIGCVCMGLMSNLPFALSAGSDTVICDGSRSDICRIPDVHDYHEAEDHRR